MGQHSGEPAFCYSAGHIGNSDVGRSLEVPHSFIQIFIVNLPDGIGDVKAIIFSRYDKHERGLQTEMMESETRGRV